MRQDPTTDSCCNDDNARLHRLVGGLKFGWPPCHGGLEWGWISDDNTFRQVCARGFCRVMRVTRGNEMFLLIIYGKLNATHMTFSRAGMCSPLPKPTPSMSMRLFFSRTGCWFLALGCCFQRRLGSEDDEQRISCC